MADDSQVDEPNSSSASLKEKDIGSTEDAVLIEEHTARYVAKSSRTGSRVSGFLWSFRTDLS